MSSELMVKSQYTRHHSMPVAANVKPSCIIFRTILESPVSLPYLLDVSKLRQGVKLLLFVVDRGRPV